MLRPERSAFSYTRALFLLTKPASPAMATVQKQSIAVTDSGAGIAPDQLSLIWDRYYKVDRVHRRAMVGTGLGLSIVKHVLDVHGAAYGVESTLGLGSTFWFALTETPPTLDAQAQL